ncbi:hypothetical protein ALISP_2776 [Alicycliphilus sp. B1]|nr:hypothetical protein ALISP_2776 [Alicycliphilus sp. B1]
MSSPWQGVAPSPASKASDSALVQSPISAPAMSSTIADSAEPLWPPKASMAPCATATGSVLGLPWASTPQPGGRGVPARRCSSRSPRAMALVAKSKTNGCCPGRGQPKAMGLVPNTGWRPPAGATQAWLGVSASAASPWAVMASISGHSAEK